MINNSYRIRFSSFCFVVLLLSFFGYNMAQSKNAEVNAVRASIHPKDGSDIDHRSQIIPITHVRSHFTKKQCCGGNCFQKLFCMPSCPLSLPSMGHSISKGSDGKVLSGAIRESRDTGSKEDSEYGAALHQFEMFLAYNRNAIDRLRQSTDKSKVQNFLVDRFTEKKTKEGKWVYDVPIDGHAIEVCRNAFVGIYGFSLNEVMYAQKLVSNGATGNSHDMSGERYQPHLPTLLTNPTHQPNPSHLFILHLSRPPLFFLFMP